jgi:hypothetical protein
VRATFHETHESSSCSAEHLRGTGAQVPRPQHKDCAPTQGSAQPGWCARGGLQFMARKLSGQSAASMHHSHPYLPPGRSMPRP